MQGTMPEIKWQIDVGHIITIVALIIAGAVAWGAMSTKLDQYSGTLVEVKTELGAMRGQLDAVRTEQIKTSTELRVRQEEDDRLREKRDK